MKRSVLDECVRSVFCQGRKITESASPQTCDPAQLKPGTYRDITETRRPNPIQGSKVEIRESGLRLESDEAIGDVTGHLSEAITQE